MQLPPQEMFAVLEIAYAAFCNHVQFRLLATSSFDETAQSATAGKTLGLLSRRYDKRESHDQEKIRGAGTAHGRQTVQRHGGCQSLESTLKSIVPQFGRLSAA